MMSGTATQHSLFTAGVKVPNIWLATDPSHGFNLCFVELLEGMPWTRPSNLGSHQVLRTVRDYAEWNIQCTKLSYDRIGSLIHGNEATIGPFIWLDKWNPEPPYFPGPFRTLAERYMAFIDMNLDYITLGINSRRDPLKAYLLHLELRELIASDVQLSQNVEETFIKHGDAGGSHIMVDTEGSISGIID
ncbi:hypothetical protein BD324DRAFT_85682 [Kockovaella imperatae]|uniref:Aminoglycoside phosphotransferase domain-containing protein n=1 Tax=Kockovaella imperatae TaxID=4999 RepID=A0A1Y1UB52_9TREE|nr:hypothetical protein BD324DRAFT_85682 [Kockovaella imperatae]ORX35261.1 hypothetical protein BD324DRAFT_85682 [Kockovaella imperatae]